jgi:hypothetical protein
VLIQKVDDPGEVVYDTPEKVIAYLKTDEADTGYFPKLTDYGNPNSKEYTNKKRTEIGDVTGNGNYWDKYNDLNPIPVQYTLRFKKSAAGVWKLASAFVTPT